jgi:putative membrane protein
MRIPTVLKALLGASCAVALLGTAYGQATAPPPAAQPAAAQPAAATTLSKADQKLLIDIAKGNMAEIEGGKITLGKTQNDQIKIYAQQIVDDHTKAQAELQRLASAKGVTLPTELDKKQKINADKLSALSGDNLDKAYMTHLGLSGHRRMHQILVNAQKKAKDPDLKAFADKVAPTVEQHLKTSQLIGTTPAKNVTGDGK